jgi:hypothetical protein
MAAALLRRRMRRGVSLCPGGDVQLRRSADHALGNLQVNAEAPPRAPRAGQTSRPSRSWAMSPNTRQSARAHRGDPSRQRIHTANTTGISPTPPKSRVRALSP